MKFVKGIVLGTVIGAGATLMYNEGMMNKKRIIKKGKQLAKNIGIF